MNKVYFVWFKGHRGLEPQKWYNKPLYNMKGKKEEGVVFSAELNEEEVGLPIPRLEEIYPKPAESKG